MHMSAMPRRPEEDVISPEAEVIGSYDPANVDVGN